MRISYSPLIRDFFPSNSKTIPKIGVYNIPTNIIIEKLSV